jgi:N-methylhydantoinase B
MSDTYDPISLEIIWNRLVSIVDEAAATLVRTSFSTVLRESNDFACVLLDAKGNSLAQSTLSVPSFIGTLPLSLKRFLEIFPAETLAPGDVIVSNDPWICSGHLPDVTMTIPIFKGERLLAFAGCIGHVPDMGGRIRSGDSMEIYEEGLQIPPSKLMKAGLWNDDLVSVILRNVRVPDMVLGDFRALIASGETLGKRLIDLMEEQDIDDLEPLARTIQQTSEKAIRNAIRELPDGSYGQEIWMDGFDEPLNIKLRLDINKDRIICDYSGTAPQINRGLNTVLNYTYAYTVYPLKCAIYPTVPNNEGCFRPFKVTAPEGSLLNPTYPAAVGGRAMVGHYLTTAVFGALQKVIPERIQADTGSPLWCVNFAGTHQGKKYATLFFLNGGQGASPHKDGISALSYPSNISNTPVEIVENSIPVMIHKKDLRADSAGAGQWRGGLGQEVEIELIGDSPCTVAFLSERIKFAPQGMNRGKPGQTGKLELNGKWIHPKTNIVIQPHDILTLWTPGGAGFWDPKKRDPERIERDVKNDMISRAMAKADYGVEVAENG